MTVKGALDSKMSPVMNSLTGAGKLSTSVVTIENFPAFVKIADALKMDQFKQMNLSNLNLTYAFANGRVNIKPFETTLAGRSYLKLVRDCQVMLKLRNDCVRYIYTNSCL